jgi:hypothetical protein
MKAFSGVDGTVPVASFLDKATGSLYFGYCRQGEVYLGEVRGPSAKDTKETPVFSGDAETEIRQIAFAQTPDGTVMVWTTWDNFWLKNITTGEEPRQYKIPVRGAQLRVTPSEVLFYGNGGIVAWKYSDTPAEMKTDLVARDGNFVCLDAAYVGDKLEILTANQRVIGMYHTYQPWAQTYDPKNKRWEQLMVMPYDPPVTVLDVALATDNDQLLALVSSSAYDRETKQRTYKTEILDLVSGTRPTPVEAVVTLATGPASNPELCKVNISAIDMFQDPQGRVWGLAVAGRVDSRLKSGADVFYFPVVDRKPGKVVQVSHTESVSKGNANLLFGNRSMYAVWTEPDVSGAKSILVSSNSPVWANALMKRGNGVAAAIIETMLGTLYLFVPFLYTTLWAVLPLGIIGGAWLFKTEWIERRPREPWMISLAAFGIGQGLFFRMFFYRPLSVSIMPAWMSAFPATVLIPVLAGVLAWLFAWSWRKPEAFNPIVDFARFYAINTLIIGLLYQPYMSDLVFAVA